jgi:AcrR family transcriptional regulator
MEAIARKARISKSSLYRDYPSKDRLYAAVVDDWVTRGRDAMRPHTEALTRARDIPAALRALARTLQEAILSSSVLRMRTLVTAEAERFPEVAADYVERSWQRNIASLGEAFTVLAERGEIHTPRPTVAAEQFTWLSVAAPLNRATLTANLVPSSPWELDSIAEQAVSTFLARYGESGHAP